MNDSYKDRTYEELAALAQKGDEEAAEFLIHSFRDVVRNKAHSYFIVGADSDDVMQEAMIGLFKAVRSYDISRGAGFRTYAEVCMNRQIISAVKAASRKKNSPLNSSVSLSKPAEDDPENTLEEMIASKSEQDPELLFIMKEIENYILKSGGEIFSDLEKKVWKEYIDGKTCGEIAEMLGKDPKAIYNAIGRAKKKIAAYIEME
ncbi:MAG: sigma-70 family RNA polymerase sigma factor [Eubacteriaceae bacterium]|nr:sigma-70 family RNA polymerase sigma factor [Eubacteriaceae bacterium]